MLVVRRCPVHGDVKTMDLPITADQMREWNSGTPAQTVFPFLDNDQREFIISGITSDVWEELFPNDAEPEEEEE